jgi:hypothetical protein
VYSELSQNYSSSLIWS